MNTNYKICSFISLILTVLFFISIFDLPYGFYTFMRILVFILSVIFIFLYYSERGYFSSTLIPVIIIGTLWNPIIPIYLTKDIWVVLDIIAAITEGALSVHSLHLAKKKIILIIRKILCTTFTIKTTY